MDLTGIENEAEFFPAGTLSEVLKDELKDITGRWAGLDKSAHPVDRLLAVSEPVLTALRQARQTQDRERQRRLIAEMHYTLVTALGYTRSLDVVPSALESAALIPRAGRAADPDGRDVLWILETPLQSVDDEASDPLGVCFSEGQAPDEDAEHLLTDRNLEDLLAEGVFALPDGPRFVLLLGGAQLILVDQRKWPARSVLRFDLQEIFSRADRDTVTVMACLLAREARVPDQGVPLSDRLEEEAQRNANAVTTSLKGTVRDAIEILGQEVLEVTDGKYPGNYHERSRRGVWIDGDSLSLECLRYMYRLLFLFYAEANPRLGLLDLKDEVYASGYSLEGLRELESKRLRTPAERQGTFLWESLQRTLTLLYSGDGDALGLPAVKVALLDPASTPLLNAVRLRNEAIQKVIRLLSLRSSRKGTGRISYAKLGIGQLGAVYETLISFTGVVAKTDLIELKPPKERASAVASDDGEVEEPDNEVDPDLLDYEEAADDGEARHDTVDKLAPSWFVPRSRIDEFRPEEVVFDGREARIYPKGSFLYRLAGRDREKTASFYTPEPLARLLVKHALMERCRDLSADDILDLKVLEPAMGSAAFLVETVNQLADIYLERKQKELGQTIPQESVVLEKQRVRAFIADRNCFGVDYNPVAVELGAISLWLNSLHASDFSPWFGDQLHAGNSLIGARRASYSPELLTASKQADLWLNHPPEEIGWRHQLPEGHIWQWLLPAKDMAAFEKDKSIRAFAGEDQERIKAWRKAGFFKKLEPHEVKLAQRLSRVAEVLFEQVADDLSKTRASANDAITLWPDKVMPGNEGLDFKGKAQLKARLTGDDHASNTLAYKRLKTAMDAWCALWLWPLDKADRLPSRAEFMQGMARLLEGGFTTDGSLAAAGIDEFPDPFPDLFDQLDDDAPARDLFAGEKGQSELFSETNVEALTESFEWLGIASEVAARERFMHFDLVFADVMRERGGFDVIVGNPPWAKPSWNEGEVLADIDPRYVGLSATEAKRILPDALEQSNGREKFLKAFVSTRGGMEITSSSVMNPFAGGGSNNLYRCFVDLAFRLVAPAGYAAMLHQDGHLGDPKSGAFRRHWYGRIAKHFEFSNKMTTKMFSEVHHELKFSLNIYRGARSNTSFEKFTHAFLPSQIEDSYADNEGIGEIPGIKGADGKWDTRGHRDRVIQIDREALSVIHSLAEDDDTPVEETRFIQPFSEKMLDVFRQMAKFLKLNEALGQENWQMSAVWNETAAQKDGTIRRETDFQPMEEVILQGPHFHVGNPLYKTPKALCRINADYEVIDLSKAPADYLPRTNYVPAVDQSEYRRRMTKCKWDPSKAHTDFYRVVFRNMIGPNSERTLIAALVPPQFAHVNTVESAAFKSYRELLQLSVLASSVPIDFFFKASGRTHIFDSNIGALAWPSLPDASLQRSILLNCLTDNYEALLEWGAKNLATWGWSSSASALFYDRSIESLEYNSGGLGLRTEFARRLALVEIDVLVAQAFGLTLDQLIEIYRIYFPVLQENEAETWYDQKGRIVWTRSKGLPGVGYLDEKGKRPGRAAWQKILEQNPDELVCTAIDDTMPGGPQRVERRFRGPFTTCDRIEDYRRAWAHFECLSAGEGA